MTARFPPLLPLARLTATELLRNKLLYVLVVFGVVVILGSISLAALTIGQWERVINDIGLATVELSTALIAILVGIGLVAGEIDRRTAFVVLAKPVSRSAFLVGRYLGLVAVLAVLVAAMGGCVQLAIVVSGYDVAATSLEALLLIFVESCVVGAVALVFSSFTTPVLGTIYSISLFVLGHLAGELESFAHRMEPGLREILVAAAYVVPNLDLLNLKVQAANLVAVPAVAVATAAAYGVAYVCAALALASRIFARRDLG